jgi:hypothetical protein
MNKEIERKSFGWSKLIAFVVLVVIVWLTWFIFFDYESCGNSACFNENLKACDKARFVGGNDMIFEYIIKGKSGGECEVEVTLLQGELNNKESINLENQAMTCFLPLGTVVSPESDISVCHGILKEGLQDLIIKKLHSYLVQNLGRLNLELADIPNV